MDVTSLAPAESLCFQADQLAHATWHKAILFFKAVTCICGMTGDIWIWRHEGTTWVGHPNARIIYVLHLFWATVVAVTYSIPIIFDLVRFLTPRSSNCDYLVDICVGFWIRFFPAYAINAQSFAMGALALERVVASVIPKRYEKIQKNYLGATLSSLAVILPAFQLVFLIVLPNKWQGMGLATSILTNDNSAFYSVHLFCQQVLEGSTLAMFIFTYILNKIQNWKIKKMYKNNLDLRYQIKETSKVLNSLLPCFLLHFLIFSAPPFVLAHQKAIVPPLSQVDIYRWIEGASEFQMYSFFMPWIIFFLRRRQKNKTIVDSHKGVDNYFTRFNGWIA